MILQKDKLLLGLGDKYCWVELKVIFRLEEKDIARVMFSSLAVEEVRRF